jgi:hypothetical protein
MQQVYTSIAEVIFYELIINRIIWKGKLVTFTTVGINSDVFKSGRLRILGIISALKFIELTNFVEVSPS